MSGLQDSIVKVLVADDRPHLRKGLFSALLVHFDPCEIDVALDGRAALRRTASWRPHLAIVGQGLPPRGGIHAIRELRKSVPDCRTILLLEKDGRPDLPRARRAGVCGVIPPNASVRAYARIVRAVHGGRVMVPSAPGETGRRAPSGG
jgi:DNA-binding NarL/FixJ family response regulator